MVEFYDAASHEGMELRLQDSPVGINDPDKLQSGDSLDTMHIRSLIHPKPEYILRPSQIIRRLVREYARPKQYEEVMLPWGLPLILRPSEQIGSWIWRLGLLELPVSEAILRLTDGGDFAIDVGANIGHMTSIMAVRVGATGRVLSFEPHPLTFQELTANLQLWAQVSGIHHVHAHRLALSDTVGEGVLDVPGDDSANRGQASVVHKSLFHGSRYSVQFRQLGEFIGDSDRIGVLKIDVEGHEYEVLKGAEAFLRRRAIRDIIFEEYRPYPTPVTAFLEAAGYTLFSVGVGFWGLALGPGNETLATREDYIPTYLATSDPARAKDRLSKRGWRALRSHSTGAA